MKISVEQLDSETNCNTTASIAENISSINESINPNLLSSVSSCDNSSR